MTHVVRGKMINYGSHIERTKLLLEVLTTQNFSHKELVVKGKTREKARQREH
jgi:hypothetical protein